MNKILLAAQMAKKWHCGQIRRYSGKPYITHPSRVASRVCLLNDVTEDMACAAWLHDVVEDCNVTLGHVTELFGDGVSNYVWELTNPSKGKSLPRSERKEMDRRHLRLVSNNAKKIKLIDRIDNVNECFSPLVNKEWLCLYLRESKLLLESIGDADPKLAHELLYDINTLGSFFGCEP